MRTRVVSFAFASLATALAACADVSSISAPRHVPSDAQLLGGLIEAVPVLGEALVAPVHRTTALDAPISWSFEAGPNGATSSNAASGLTIAIPKGALASTVTITVTALAGSAVAYGFQPHGLTFLKKVQLTQSMSGLQMGLLTSLAPIGAHFPGDAPAFTDGLALVDELIGARLNLFQNSVSFPITHFSGWIVATGRSSQGETESQ